ncbi:hypothetical protein RYX36_016004 [Vicia faba]
MVDLEGFLSEIIMKAQGMLKKQIEENQKKEMAYLSSQFMHNVEYCMENMRLTKVTSLITFIDKSLKDVEQRLDSMDVCDQEEVANGARVVNEEDLLANMDNATIEGWARTLIIVLHNDGQCSINFSKLPFDDVNFSPNGF